MRACRLGCLGPDELARAGWSGRAVASVSVWMPWTGRVDPNGLVRRGCRERVGWDALGRPSRPEWVGPCTVWIRSFWFETAVPCPLFPALRAAAFRALFRCLLCLARTSLHPGVAFLCFGLLPSVLCFAVSYASPVPPCTQVVASCSPRPASLSPRPRSFLPFGLHPLALRTTLFCVPARFLLLSSLCPRSSPCKRKPPKAWPSGVFGYCRSRITSQEPSG